MNLSHRLLTLPMAALLVTAAPLTASESTKTLKIEMAPSGEFAVENLAGTMRVSAGTGDKVVVTATVHGESSEVADELKLEQVVNEKGIPTLRVIYPTDKYSTFRYPGRDSGHNGSGWFSGWLGGSSTSTKYAGHKVKVSEGSGTLLYADVAVQLPRNSVEGTFRNIVGQIDGSGVEGTLKFDSGSGDITLNKLKGAISADTGSGDIKAEDVNGSFNGDTGSGDINLSNFESDMVKCDTGSGNVDIADGTAGKVDVDTGSGDVHVEDVDVEEVSADTGSGDVLLVTRGEKLRTAKADTGSGDVTMRLSAGASFEAMADIGSGDIVNHYSDAQPITKNREIIGYRRGDARTKIDVQTGSGDFVLEPAR
jgi:DUF4097 and DUF4098 domain-containing protein YvlB